MDLGGGGDLSQFGTECISTKVVAIYDEEYI